MYKIACLGLLVILFTFPGRESAAELVQADDFAIEVTTVTDSLVHPWGMAFLPDGRILITERRGRLQLLDRENNGMTRITGLPANIAVEGQGGLLDVALHPEFSENQLIYLSYAGSGKGGLGTEVVRGRLSGDRLRDTEVIFRALPKQGGGRHFGSRLLFAPDGTLFVSLGDRGHRPNGQDTGTHPGSLIRINADGTVPAFNPFLDQSGVRPGIFTLGNRNMQGMALHPQSGEVWTHEHGPQGGDEVNIMLAGKNYGWPVITYGKNYVTGTDIGEGTRKQGMEQPVHYWVPSIAPSGMAFYTGDEFPEWQGDLLVGSLKFGLLVRLVLDGDKVTREERLLDGKFGRIRDVRQGPDDSIYLLTDMQDGRLLRLQKAP